MDKQGDDTQNEHNAEFIKTAKIFHIPPERWNEQVVRKGIPLLSRAEQLQTDLSTALDFFKDGVDFGREELLMRCICAMLEDKLTGKNEFSDYIKGKAAAAGFKVKNAKS